MASNSGVDTLKGTWDFVDEDNFDAYMKELGIGVMTRITVKSIKPRLVVSENAGKWTLRSESSVKTTSYDFTPGVEFNETTPDGREVKSKIVFQGSRWVHTQTDKNGKKSVVTRHVDDKGQHMIEMECGPVTARRWYKRA